MRRIGLLALISILWAATGAVAPEPLPPSPFSGDLARAVFFGDRAITRFQPRGLPEPLRARFTVFRERFARFKSHLSDAGLPREGPERWQFQKRRHVERAIVSLIPHKDIQSLAADYARRATIHYEWEGMSDGPLAEAEFAEATLQEQPDTPLRPYLNLFLVHRLRYAQAFLASEKKPDAAAVAASRAAKHRAAAANDPDPLIRAVAADIELLPVRTAARDASPECGEPHVGRRVEDPALWVTRCVMESDGPCTEPTALVRFELDLDLDGVPELLLGCPAEMGNAGGMHHVFRTRGNVAEYLGALFLHPRAIRVLPAEGDGKPRLVRYVRHGAGEGTLDTVVWDGDRFRVLRTETVHPQGKDAQRLKELFGWP